MTTANDLISGALRVISSATPGEAIDGSEADNALTVLNRMLKSWSAKSLMVPYRTLESFSVTAGTNSRTIGTGAQLDTARPDYVTGAYLRNSNNVDYPVATDMTKEQYNAIAQKTLAVRPIRLYYDTQYPSGVIYFESALDKAYTLFLESLKPVNQFTTLQTAIAFPGEYEEPIVYLLAQRLAPEYGFSIAQNPDIKELIEEADAFIKRKNTKPKAARFDGALLKPQPYNILNG